MAEPLDTLLQVQERDTAVDQLRRKRETLPDRAALSGVRARREELARATVDLQRRVDDLSARQAALEERTASTAQRRHDIERRMESGMVSASRDLQAMDLEVHHLADRQGQLEEEELALLEEQDPLDVELDVARTRADELRAEAEQLAAAIAESEAELDGAIDQERAARAELVADLPADLVGRYEALRARLGGVGAARLVGDRCEGCHLTLPSVDVERIRHLPPDETATCPHCDRILVH
jgi:uncharacterized protein